MNRDLIDAANHLFSMAGNYVAANENGPAGRTLAEQSLKWAAIYYTRELERAGHKTNKAKNEAIAGGKS